MRQLKIKRIGVFSTGWLFAILGFCLYLIPLCVSQFKGQDCEVTIIGPFLKIQPPSSLAIAYLLIAVPLLGFITGVLAALFANLALRLGGGFKLEVEADPFEPSASSDPHSVSAQEGDGRSTRRGENE